MMLYSISYLGTHQLRTGLADQICSTIARHKLEGAMRTHQRLSRVIWTLFSVGALIVGVPGGSLAQQPLVLTTSIGQAEFFEDEPIYLLVRLQNVGSDTARVYFFNLMSPAVKLSVSR